MTKKKNRKPITEEKFAIIAAVFLIFVSMFNPTTAATIAIALLVGFAVYKYFSKKK